MQTRPVLVDTSAWIASFRRSSPERLRLAIDEALQKDLVATCPPVLLEILQGCRSEAEFGKMKERFDSLHFYPATESIWDRAYRMAFELRNSGLTIPGTDVLIAAIAIENNLDLLHHDQHFRMIAGRYDLGAKDFIPK